MCFGGIPCQDTFCRHEVSIDTPEQNQPKAENDGIGFRKRLEGHAIFFSKYMSTNRYKTGA